MLTAVVSAGTFSTINISNSVSLSNMNMLWSSTSKIHTDMWQCVKKDRVKEGRQRDNCMESEHRSWGKLSFSLRGEGGRLKRLFIFHLEMETEERWGEPQRNYWLEMYPPGATVSLFSLFLPLPLTFHLPPFWSSPESCHCLSGRWGKRRRKRGAAHSRCHLCLPHSQTLFIPHSCGLQSCARLCSAVAASSEPSRSCSSGSSQACLSQCGKQRFLSQPSSLTAFPSHTRVIKKATCPPPIPSGVFLSSFYFTVRMNRWCECLGWHLYSTRTRVNYWEAEKWGYIISVRPPLHGLSRHLCVVMGAHERLPFYSLFLLMNKGVKCILTFRSFGRFPIAYKSQDTKNKSAAESMQGNSYFQTDVRQSLPLSTI